MAKRYKCSNGSMIEDTDGGWVRWADFVDFLVAPVEEVHVREAQAVVEALAEPEPVVEPAVGPVVEAPKPKKERKPKG
jgi:hypothetical protein